jgi:cytochrome P450
MEGRERSLTDLRYDPYDAEIDADPYPVSRRLRDEAPLYYNDEYDFYAVSRYADCRRGLADAKHHISGRGGILELIKAIRHSADAGLRTEAGQPMEVSGEAPFSTERFAEYIDWRIGHPSDDLMTELLHAEFEDETASVRCLRREEALLYATVVAGAGNETTTRLIGWAGKVLAEHPDQRRELVEDPSLIPNAIEELLRYESPGPHLARFLPEDVDLSRAHLAPTSTVRGWETLPVVVS